MLTVILAIVIVILLTIGIVWVIDKFVPKGLKPVINFILLAISAFIGYQIFMSVYGEIQFNEIKQKRYAIVIENLKDIRDAELAYRQVHGKFTDNFDELVNFIDTGKFTITQRRDTTVFDAEATKRFHGVVTTKEIILVDTLGFVPVKDSLFGSDTRYKTMMNVPVGKPNSKFTLKAGFLDKIPVFEASVDKAILLDDQDEYLIAKEKQVVSVDGVNGPKLMVGSMDEIKTNGNWPKNYSKD